jgi:long-chain acyl-CoA synthetase
MEQVFREKGDTWPKILLHNYETYGDRRKAMRYKHYGIWHPYTWKDYYLDVKYLALGLLSLGFERGDRLLIIGDNAPEWYSAELAAQANHGVSVGVYADFTPPEIRYVAENSEARFAIVEDQEQVDKLLQIEDELPLLQRVIHWSYKGLAHYDDASLIGYREVLQLGKTYEEQHPGVFEQNVKAGKADDVCALVYTSGTTGTAPKAAVHTYKTMMAGADYLLSLDPWRENDHVVPYLPPSWMTEQWSGIGCHLLCANILNFAEAPETLQRDTSEAQPSIVFYGAGVWESQASNLQARILRANAINRFVSRLLMPVGYKMVDLKLQKKKQGVLWKMLYFMAEIFLFKPMKDSLGLSNARICYSTGAILSPDALRFYHALGVPLKSIYVSTEGGVLSGAKDDQISLETVVGTGKGAEVRIADYGELIYRQAGVFAGYYKDPDKTAQVLKEGWFHSGDKAFIREDGHMVFVDRVKDFVELPGGDELAPQMIESRLRFSPYIKDAWVLAGPKKEYASAVIVINYDNVRRWAGLRKVAYETFADLSQMPEVHELLKLDIQRINNDLPSGARLKKYVHLHKELDPDEGELTRNRKLRRRFLEERYRELIDAIYDGKSEIAIEAQVRHRDGRIGTAKTTIHIKTVEGVA